MAVAESAVAASRRAHSAPCDPPIGLSDRHQWTSRALRSAQVADEPPQARLRAFALAPAASPRESGTRNEAALGAAPAPSAVEESRARRPAFAAPPDGRSGPRASAS